MSNNQIPLVLYHGECCDGFTAAWVAHRYFAGKVELVPVHHGQMPPDVARRVIFLLDFSYKQDVIRRMVAFNEHVTILDHHQTAQAELEDPRLLEKCAPKLTVQFDMTKSGARLAWEWFFPEEEPPFLVRLVEDRDLWEWNMPDSLALNAYLATLEFDLETWDRLHVEWSGNEHSVVQEKAIAAGKTVLRYQDQLVEQIRKNAHAVTIAEVTVLAANTPILRSEVAGLLASGQPFGATYYDRHDGQRIWSLRSDKNGLDVANIAAQFGGGGHRHAAGFQTKADDREVVPGEYPHRFSN